MPRYFFLAATSVFLLICSSLSQAQSTILCVVSVRDFESESDHPCQESCQGDLTLLQDVQEIVDQYRQVELHLIMCSAEYNSNDVSRLQFANLQAVTISSVNRSSLNCQGEVSGLRFDHVRRIDIRGVTFNQCGFEINDVDFNFTVGVYIADSTNILVRDVTIIGTPGIGLALLNNSGFVNITDSQLIENHAMNYSRPGSGVLIKSNSSQLSNYHFENCDFVKNRADSGSQEYFNDVNWRLFVRGGGMNIFFGVNSSNIHLFIVGCRFIANRAKHGGALHLLLQDPGENVEIEVVKTRFENNKASKIAGAVYVKCSTPVAQNHIKFSSCNFIRNKGEIGGGVFILLTPNYKYLRENYIFSFLGCNWTANDALHGSAVMIEPYIPRSGDLRSSELPVSLFRDCSFVQNTFYRSRQEIFANYNISYYSTGIIHVNTFTIMFQGMTNFTQNRDTAVYLFSSTLEIFNHSTIIFFRNYGYQGGAINMHGLATIYLNDNVFLNFTNNSALDKGGAIYHSSPGNPSHFSDKNCFIQYVGQERDVNRRNITLVFDSNTKVNVTETVLSDTKFDYTRQSLFLFSVEPCCNIYRKEKYEIMNVLNMIGSFQFKQTDDKISTFASQFEVGNLPTTFIPGIEKELNILLLDDLNATITPPVYKVVMFWPHDGSIAVDPGYTITTNNKIKLIGSQGAEGKVELVLLTKPSMGLTFNIFLEKCPPGYVFEQDNAVCVCSANTNGRLYLGIKRCNATTHQASLVHGYWAGYVDENGTHSFRTSSCPLGYCGNRRNDRSEIPLPYMEDSLNDEICSNNRMGVICSECKNSTSVLYQTFECKAPYHCNLGLLFFTLSQILPVTVLFLAVILFDLQLTTGSLNGFLFFVQLFKTLSVSANNFIDFPVFTRVLQDILNFIVSIFNLKFFYFPQLSFCLFEGATSLDVIAFDYITVFYSLLLIVFTVLMVNLRCNRVKRILQILRRRKRVLFSQSVIHGLSGFLVMCYSRTTTTTLQILTPVWTHNEGPQRQGVRVFYYAKLTYFHGDHLRYAIPAAFALVLMTIMPPILLLSYPLCYKVLSFLRLGESKFTKFLCWVIPLEKFKPFFDSFQGAFRDKHRYFSGLYFVYRLSALMIYALVSNLTDFYFYLGIQLTFMLVLHAWVQPYKKKKHNLLDLYLFSLLLILNTITYYNYQWTLNQIDREQVIEVFSTIQVLLAYSPIIIMIAFVLRKLRVKTCIKYLRDKFVKKKGENYSSFTLSILDNRDGDDSEANYQQF